MLNRERAPKRARVAVAHRRLRALSEMATPSAAKGCGTLKRTRLGGYVGIETHGRSVRPILTFTHRYHLLAIGSESRQPVTLNYPVTLDYMAHYMLSDLSFDDYLHAGGWRGYAQRAAKDAFVCEARS